MITRKLLKMTTGQGSAIRMQGRQSVQRDILGVEAVNVMYMELRVVEIQPISMCPKQLWACVEKT